ncbi:hypothetical protein HPP92_018043 [Vanilla planifolia]|uniref:Uncharacterized protein n=1 Tax=Vanilla planifolia TaxID=51239 RepID=A0A835UQ82_VANPL|nr:hypothetical protein HPP92_018043 [Vanilla planifolia]
MERDGKVEMDLRINLRLAFRLGSGDIPITFRGRETLFPLGEAVFTAVQGEEWLAMDSLFCKIVEEHKSLVVLHCREREVIILLQKEERGKGEVAWSYARWFTKPEE